MDVHGRKLVFLSPLKWLGSEHSLSHSVHIKVFSPVYSHVPCQCTFLIQMSCCNLDPSTSSFFLNALLMKQHSQIALESIATNIFIYDLSFEMDFHMLFQVAGPRTFIITFCTRIRFFSCMCSNMLCQSTLLNKYLVAIWFRAIVGWSPGQLLFMDTPHMK